MMVRLVDAQATLYVEPHRTSAAIADLPSGKELWITDQLTSEGETWVSVALPDERDGYLPSGTRIERCPIVELAGDAAIRTVRGLGRARSVWSGRQIVGPGRRDAGWAHLAQGR